MRQGLFRDVLAVLAPPLPQTLLKVEFAIQRDLYRTVALERLGDLKSSRQALDEARRLVEESHSPLEAELFNTRGVLEVDRGDLIHADPLFRQGLELARKQGDRYLEASILLNLGVIALGNEHYDEALYWCQAATQIASAIHASLILEKALANEGWAYYELGDYERSLSNSQQAVVQAEKLGSAADQVRCLNNAGQAMSQLHDLKNAEATYRKSLAVAETIQNKQGIANAHGALVFLLLESGQDDSANVHIDQSLAAAQAQGNEPAELPLLLARSLIAVHQSRLEDADRILKTIYQSPLLTPSLRWEVEDALANLHAKQQGPNDAEEWYRKSIHTFERQRSSLNDDENKLPFFGNARHLYRDYVEYLIGRGKTEQALEVLDAGRARTLEEGLGISSRRTSNAADLTAKTANSKTSQIDPRAIAQAVGGTVLEYSLGPTHSYLWAITPAAVRLFELPQQAEIDSRVNDYQRNIANSNDVLATRDDGGLWLYNHLVAPASSMIPSHSKVFLIPDGSLNHVNFETMLVNGPNPHYWLEDVTLTTADSLRMLRTFRAHTPASQNARLLLIGNPISPADEFADLPNASAEVASVARHFPPGRRRVLTRAEASPAAYSASHPDQFAYIHFVAHGVASQLRPLDSAVLLSRTPERPDNFKLYARDIVHLPLRAELVTISTCHGSGTKSYEGEGLVGLSWAFIRAGSHNVIGAMWAVSDASTPQLMDHLYDSLEKGSTPDVALRAAKLSMAHSAGVYRKPLYWAAFQLYAGS